MTPFYYVDGPLKGQIRDGNFKQERHNLQASFLPLTEDQKKETIYYKYTYAVWVQMPDVNLRVCLDIASTHETVPKIDLEQDYPNLLVEAINADGRFVELPEGAIGVAQQFLSEAEPVPDGGQIHKVKVNG